MNRSPYIFGIVGVAFLAGFGLEAGAGTPSSKKITITRDADTLTTHIFIEAHKGQVAWADVLAGLARAKGYDDAAFADLLPDATFSIDRYYSGMLLTLGNRALPKGIHLDRERLEVGGDYCLTISLDRVALLASKRRLQKLFREHATKTLAHLGHGKPRDYAITLDKDWHKTPKDKPLVILIPGFQAGPHDTDFHAQHFRKLGFLVGSCSYPNDQPIEESAKHVARELRKIAKKQPGRPVRLVTFSMGGLVARRVLEDAALDPGNVRQLIQIAAPNQGSRIACLGFINEFMEHVVESTEPNWLKRFYASIEDGLGEAAEDMEPDSLFLKELNARPRNPKVQYSLFLGNQGVLAKESLDKLRAKVKTSAKTNRLLQFLGPRLDAWLADLDEVLPDKGDGAVAVKRGKLTGVSDVVVLSFNHMGINRDPRYAGERRLLEEIGKRLQKPLT